uniref:Uncharacterized protein n=1 Tax=Romanomermis culicivorax TaxID=13658 RepID=A0A915L5X5_ROMCU
MVALSLVIAIYLASTSQLGHTIRRSRNYIRDINPTTMKAIWPNKIIHYRLAIVGVFSDSYVDKILAVIRMINRISCLEFTRVPTGDTLPPKTVAGLTLEPVVVFTKVTTEKECFAVINNNRIQVLLHDTICGSSVDIMAVTLSVLGAIIPKGSNLRLYDLMPWNLRE